MARSAWEAGNGAAFSEKETSKEGNEAEEALTNCVGAQTVVGIEWEGVVGPRGLSYCQSPEDRVGLVRLLQTSLFNQIGTGICTTCWYFCGDSG